MQVNKKVSKYKNLERASFRFSSYLALSRLILRMYPIGYEIFPVYLFIFAIAISAALMSTYLVGAVVRSGCVPIWYEISS
jgi:hypothetical protein